jgi:flagellar hook-basal body complex protein FliE
MITSVLSLFDRVAPAGSARPSEAVTPAGETGIPAASFGTMVGELAADTVAALEKSEAVSLNALQGKAETREAVDAVMDAEQSLQAAIAIRDKIVAAYLEISRMAI